MKLTTHHERARAGLMARAAAKAVRDGEPVIDDIADAPSILSRATHPNDVSAPGEFEAAVIRGEVTWSDLGEPVLTGRCSCDPEDGPCGFHAITLTGAAS